MPSTKLTYAALVWSSEPWEWTVELSFVPTVWIVWNHVAAAPQTDFTYAAGETDEDEEEPPQPANASATVAAAARRLTRGFR
jgi:hypothetical protein